MKNRGREFRKMRGWTVDTLAEKTGLSKSQISRIENEKRGWSVESLNVIADAMGVSVAELLSTSDAWIKAPIFGTVGDCGTVAAMTLDTPEEIDVPAAYGDVLALRVESDSLYPRYLRGEHVLCRAAVVDPKQATGKECLVFLTGGRALLRVVNLGTKPRLYTLTSHNHPPRVDVAIATCRIVLRF
jgi:transcriptional regulator with XRE-family HTH domain